jgi:ABC-type transport system involved in cytochrome c biogenesis ATPase subunit
MLGLDDIDPGTLAGALPLHQLQLVEVARALNSGAELILIDEPTASLTIEETGRLFEVLRRLRDQGIGMVLVSVNPPGCVSRRGCVAWWWRWWSSWRGCRARRRRGRRVQGCR